MLQTQKNDVAIASAQVPEGLRREKDNKALLVMLTKPVSQIPSGHTARIPTWAAIEAHAVLGSLDADPVVTTSNHTQ